MVATNIAERNQALQTWTVAEPSFESHLLVASDTPQPDLIDGAARALAQAVAAKDPTTGGHLQRLAAYALLVGQRLGLSADALGVVHCGALLHDVGKIGVADAILQKPGRLTEDEYRQMQQHPVIGEQIVASLPIGQLIAPIVRGHHERWDGRGYPDGLAGEAIHPGARIVAVIDSFDAMTAERPYSRPMTVDAAMICLRAGAGSQWDPDVVEALIDCLTDIVGERERALGDEAAQDELTARRLSAWLESAAA
jgi:HD-GYP domain-containing protein (c-di-GMP phosphodiesterase class II)